MRLPPTAPAVERQPARTAGTPATSAVHPAATGKCYDNPDCENSIWPGRGKRVLQNSTVQQCYTAVGANGAWKGAARHGDTPFCYPLAGEGYQGLLLREQNKLI
jgi:hypothetical protein